MSQEWYPTSELTGLLGMPGTDNGVRAKARREAWQSQPRKGHGGGYEYHIDSLPAETKSALLDQAIESLPETVCHLPAVKEKHEIATAEDLPTPASLPAWRRNTMDARLQILGLVEQLANSFGISKAIDKVVARAKTETLPEHIQALIPVANARSNNGKGKQTLSRRTLFRWRDLRTVGTTALAPAEPAKKPIPVWVPYFLKCWQVPQHISIQDALDQLETVLPETIQMPSYSQANRFLKKMSAVDRERGRMSPKELKALKPYRRRDTGDLQPLDVTLCDGHSFKARIAHPIHGKPFHPECCAVIDAATHVVIGWSVGLAESAETVADALRHGITVNPKNERGGIPAIFYTDPGSGNKAKVNSHPVFGRYHRAGIEFRTGITGNSQARGLVENLQKGLWIRAARQLETYTGKDMDPSVEHKNYRILMKDIREMGRSNMLPTWPQFIDLCQQAVNHYNNRPNSALPKITDSEGRPRYMTPNECWDTFIAYGWTPDTASPQELDDMFRPRRQVTTRRGQVRLFGNIYFNKDLQHHNGEKVFIEYEPQDGQHVYVRDMEERLICKAEFEANRSSFYPVSAVEEAREKRAERRAKLKIQQLEEIELERRGVVEIEPIKPAQISHLKQQLIEAEEAEVSNVVQLPTDAPGRIRFYRDLTNRMNKGLDIEEKEADWLDTFKQSTEYQTLIDMEADFPELKRDIGQ